MFNAAKCEIGVTEISFLGDVISDQGIQPSPAAVRSVLDIPSTTDKLGVQRMLGVAHSFGKFLPGLAEKTQLMRQLIKKDASIEWSENHARQWDDLRQNLSRQPVLAIFNPRKKTKIASDASQKAA